jgi:hypothetical protein
MVSNVSEELLDEFRRKELVAAIFVDIHGSFLFKRIIN